ncbi:MAG: MFS transporter [Magnetovibrio sp.]|nr:MFS transporter [Magnetovibrio sp.]|tara:strand:+ start:348 stop:1577 length:1230 start_codon:yes stop_codon:yes gene_type:complete
MEKNYKKYTLVTVSYWGFTLTDGALRMLVLLHFHSLGYSPFEIALLFLFYELFGIFTNLIGGWIATRIGLKVTLFLGLTLQVIALCLLALFDPAWPITLGVIYVMAVQAISGIAKDLTKLSSKSAVKLIVPGNKQTVLFKFVSALTGSKNALKGVGFFMGGALLVWLGFSWALISMASGLMIVLLTTVISLHGDLGQLGNKVRFRHIFSKSAEINWLSGARFFLFGSRDIWFAVGLPLFLAVTMNWDHMQIGGYMAIWVIAYGLVQVATPKLLKKSDVLPDGQLSRRWIIVLILVTLSICTAVHIDIFPGLSVVIGLLIFGFVFAINSAIHSYLVLAYSEADRVSLDVGFYYMANAGGRLIGTLLSGLVYQLGGFVLCLLISTAFLISSWLFSITLPNAPEKLKEISAR